MSLENDVAQFLKSGGKVTQIPPGVVVWEKGRPLRMSNEDLKAMHEHERSIPFVSLHHGDIKPSFSKR